MRRRAACAERTTALPQPARYVAHRSRLRPANDVAWPLHRVDRNRRNVRPDRSGLGPARFALESGRTQALPARSRIAALAAAAGCRHRFPRSLRSPGLSDRSPARETRSAIRDFTRCGRSLGIVGSETGSHHRAGLVGVACVEGRHDHGGALATFLRSRAQGSQRHVVVIDGHPARRATRCSSAATRD